MKTKSKHSINQIVLAGILSIAGCVIVILTVVEFFFNYQRDMDGLNRQLDTINKTYLPEVIQALEEKEQEKLESNLVGIFQIHGVVSVILDSPLGKRYTYDDHSKFSTITRQYVLESNVSGNKKYLGELKVLASRDEIMDSLKTQILIYFLSLAIGATFAAIVLTFMFHRIFTHKIIKLTEVVENINVLDVQNISHLKVGKYTWDNEFNLMVSSINKLLKNLSESIADRDHELQLKEKAQEEFSILQQKLEDEIKRRSNIIIAQERKLFEVSRIETIAEIAGGIAHEINNPLAIIQGSLSIMKRSHLESVPNDSMFCHFVEKARAANHRIGIITARLLEITTQESNSEPQREDPRDLLVSVFESLDDDIARLDLSVDIIDQLRRPKLLCRREQVITVFKNITRNALEALEQQELDRRVVVTLRSTHTSLEVLFSNNGPKIPEDIQSRVLQPFTTSKAVGVGLGLGLSICQGTLVSMGGEIQLISSDDRWTTFLVIIPDNVQGESKFAS